MKDPGYFQRKKAAAMRRENEIRNAAVLDIHASICGRPVRQMTLWHWVILDGIGSPFLLGQLPGVEDVLKFLWVLHPRYDRAAIWRREWFYWQCRKLPYGMAVEQSFRFVKETFIDAPGSSEGDAKAPFISVAASLAHTLAKQYHWSHRAILHLPIKVSFQYLKALDVAAGGKRFNGLSGPIESQRLRVLNGLEDDPSGGAE